MIVNIGYALLVVAGLATLIVGGAIGAAALLARWRGEA